MDVTKITGAALILLSLAFLLGNKPRAGGATQQALNRLGTDDDISVGEPSEGFEPLVIKITGDCVDAGLCGS